MVGRTAQPAGAAGLLMAGLVAVVCALAPARALATDGEDFVNARDAYIRGEYARAVQLFEAMVGGEIPAIRDAVLIQESREYLGAAYVLTGARELATRQFEALLRSQGEEIEQYQLDPTAFPSSVLDVFEEVRRRLLGERQEREQEEARRAAVAEQDRREAVLELIGMAEQDELEVPHDPLLAWIPFGAGQFQNGDEELGAFFLTTEALTFVGGLVAFSVYLPLLDRYQDLGPYLSGVEPGLLRGLQAANWVALGAFGVLAVAGIIEAHARFVPSHTVRRRREVPRDLLDRLDLSVGPGSVDLRIRF